MQTIFRFVLTVTFVQMLGAQASQASDLKLKAEVGYDDNPFRLSDDFSPEGARFFEARLKSELDLSQEFFLLGHFHMRRYESIAKDADSFKGGMGLGYQTTFKTFKKKMLFDAKLDAGLRDKTYISRLTGEVAESGGEAIEDRYDYEYARLASSFKIKLNRRSRLGLKLTVEKRDYEDYSDENLSNYDYLESFLEGHWRSRFLDKHRFKLSLESSFRDYDNRRARDLNGATLAGTDLKYFNLGAGLQYQYELGKATQVEAKLKLRERWDNEQGYYDARTTLAGISVSQALIDPISLKLGVSYRDYDYYNRRLTNNTVEDEFSAEQAFRYSASLRYQPQAYPGLKISLSVRHDDVDADIEEYRYQRNRLQLGLNFRL